MNTILLIILFFIILGIPTKPDHEDEDENGNS